MLECFRRRRLTRLRLEAQQAKAVEKGLLASLLALENTRMEQQMRLDQSRAELELKRVQWETENAEALQRAKEADAKLKQELRIKNREHSQMMRDKKAEKARAAQQQQTLDGAKQCRVCEGGHSDLSSAEITWHYNGHNYGPSLFPNA